MSLAMLSERTGIDKTHLSKVQNGKAGLSDENIRKLAEAMDCSPADITHQEQS